MKSIPNYRPVVEGSLTIRVEKLSEDTRTDFDRVTSNPLSMPLIDVLLKKVRLQPYSFGVDQDGAFLILNLITDEIEVT